MEFPTELGILTCLMIFAASMWIPYVIGISSDPAEEDAFDTPATISRLRPWVQRAHRAHLNLLEQGIPFAILVLLVDRMDGFTALTYWTAIAFFWIRVAHAAGMISGMARMPLRPILFTAGWICCLIMAYAVFTAQM
ncbi:MAPEG family protein [Rhodophyticola sp. CCM32]|uniref:MAPEG family protein n=1 Tax=Rhodophyticola sp. CCM32 TaxID=2916397 RepID=UPI001EE5CE39|nr:MAPEG family protein [Rhodophyticola sp. CCM32]